MTLFTIHPIKLPDNSIESVSLPPPGSLINLNTILDQISLTNQCLVTIDNFYSLDITPTNSPITLRKYVLGVRNISRGGYSNYNYIFLRPKYNLTGYSMYPPDHEIWVDLPVPCPFSDLLVGTSPYNIGTFCVTYDLNLFTISPKPWNCEVYLNMFYPTRYFDFKSAYPSMFYIYGGYSHYFSMSPSSRFNIYGIIYENTAYLQRHYFDMLSNTRALSAYKSRIKSELNILFEFKEEKTIVSQQPVFNLYQAYVLCYCMFC